MTPTPAHIEEAAVLLGFEGPGLRHILEAPRWCGDGNDGSCFAGECEHVENVQNVARAIAERDETWEARFVESTTHTMEPTPCAVVGRMPACTCGAHARQAQIHAEIAAKHRARPGVARVREER